MNHAQLFAIAQETALKYGNGRCDAFAEAFRKALQKHGMDGQLVRLRSRHPFIVVEDPAECRFGGQSITINGNHYGVQVGEFVFDNVMLSPKKRADWENAFQTRGGRPSVEEISWSKLHTDG